MSWIPILCIFALGFWLGSFWQLKRQHRIQSHQNVMLAAFVDHVIENDQALYAGYTGSEKGATQGDYASKRRHGGAVAFMPESANRKPRLTRGGAHPPEAA